MATTTTNFGWDIPQSTDLVKDGATAIAALGQDIDTAFIDLKGGTTGQVLAKASNTDLDYSWVAQDDSNAIQNAIVDAKGDLITATANDTPARLAVGTNGHVLTADSTAATGIKWAAAASSPTFSGVSVSLASNYSLANGTSNFVPFTIENFDTDAFHDNSTNTSRLTVPSGKAGKYLVYVNAMYNANAVGVRSTAIRLNGATYSGSFDASICGAGTNQSTQVAKVLNLSVGDYIEVDCFQSSGSTLLLISGLNATVFGMTYLGA